MEKEYYSIITKKFILRTSHFGWLETTRNLYNDILEFYYTLFLEHEEYALLDKQQSMRALERLTIVGRDKNPVPNPLPWSKIPLYFRRAVIAEAIGAGRSYLGRKGGRRTQEVPTQKFASGITFYKGMYRDLTSKSIELKVYDGGKWQWLHCRLSGNELPENTEHISPKMVFKQKQIELHVPVRIQVNDGRKLRERIDENLRVCSLQFTNRDALAVCCIMDNQGEICDTRFIRGGRNYEARCKEILQKIERSQMAIYGNKGYQIINEHPRLEGVNKKYRQKLYNISEDMAHRVSCDILDFCVEHHVSVIIFPKYSRDFTRRIMWKTGKWSTLRMSTRIREKLNYKAWKKGILVVEVESSDISRSCSICGSDTRKNGEEFICTNGHKGNRHLNSARNLGKKFLNNMKK